MPPTEPSGRPARYSDTSAMVTEYPRSSARRAIAPRGSTPCATAPRPASASRRPPSPQSACTRSPPGLRATRCAATGPAHGPSSRAGTSQAAPSTGRSSSASRASSVATRAERKRKASTTWPIASSSSLGAPSAALPLPAPAQPATAARPPAAGAALALERVRQRRGAGVVGAVAVAEMGEGRQEVPRVAPLGRQPREGGAQGLRRPLLVRRPRSCARVVPSTPAARLIGHRRRGEGCGHGGRCYRRCASQVGERQFGRRSRATTFVGLEWELDDMTTARRLTRLMLAIVSVAGCVRRRGRALGA